MADDDEKFPDFQPVNLINPDLKQAQWGYIQSASTELVTFFKSLRCKKCKTLKRGDNQSLFSFTNPPFIALCGHYVHEDCLYEKVLHKTGEEEEHERRRFDCPQEKCRTLPTRNNFKPFALFQEFYRWIEMSGFPCIGCEKHGNIMAHHPHNNVVRIISRPFEEIVDAEEELSKYENNAEYLCVWCCAKTSKYSEYYVRLVKSTEQAIDDRSIRLSSVDRTLPCSNLPNLECCCCMKPMIPTRFRSGRTDRDSKMAANEVRKYVTCGHIRDEGCIASDGYIYCNLCEERYALGDIDGKDAVSYFECYSSANYLPGHTKISYNVFKCVTCKTFHPLTNMRLKDKDQTCVWCAVEGTLESRKNGWDKMRQEEEEEERKEREQRRSRSGSSGSIFRRLRQSSVSRGTANDEDPLIQ